MQLATMAVMAACSLALGAEVARAAEPAPFPAREIRPSPYREGGRGPSPASFPPWARAYSEGQWSAAIKLIETIPEASRTPSHWLHLARAFEKCTQLVESFAAYERLFDAAAESPSLTGMKEVVRRAKSESAALAHRIPWAEVALGQELAAGTFVWVDQQWLEPARLRSPYPVNPGWHTFLVELDGEVLAARRVFFEEGQSRLVPLTPFGERKARGADAMDAAAPGDERTTEVASTRRRSLRWHAENPTVDTGRQDQLLRASYLSLGVGALGAAAGTGLALAAAQDNDAAGKSSAAVASYAVGFGALITGGVFWFLHRDAVRSAGVQSPSNAARIALEPRVYPSGAVVRGTF
jgi:hypothetical protein